jgi:hypothetical protein
MIKLITHLLIFVIGAGVGMAWGVHHPQEAQNLDLRIQKEVAQAKVDLLHRFMTDNPKAASTYQQEADDAQKKLDDANQQLGNQPNQ